MMMMMIEGKIDVTYVTKEIEHESLSDGNQIIVSKSCSIRTGTVAEILVEHLKSTRYRTSGTNKHSVKKS